MENLLIRLEALLEEGHNYFKATADSEINNKPHPDKWSKKEILGHLIDSGINNLQRFTEIQFEDKPYKIRSYNQDQLVKANGYQNSEISEILQFWIAINNRIKNLIKRQTEASLNFKIVLKNGKESDLRFLMIDYVDHLEHHMNQIKNN